MRLIFITATLLALLSGCASLVYDPYTVTLVNRETNVTGIGEAPRDWTPGGPVTVSLDSTTYIGEWFHIPSDEAVLVERWGEPERWADLVSENEMTGTAEMLLIASDDDKLRCQLRFNLDAKRGTGVCKAFDGGFYDLRFESP